MTTEALANTEEVNINTEWEMLEHSIGSNLNHYEPTMGHTKYTTLKAVEAAILEELSIMKTQLVTTKLDFLYMKNITNVEKTTDIFSELKTNITSLNEKLARVRQKMLDLTTFTEQTEQYEKLLKTSIYNLKTCAKDTPFKEIARGNLKIQTILQDIKEIKNAAIVLKSTHFPDATDKIRGKRNKDATYSLLEGTKPVTLLVDTFYLQETIPNAEIEQDSANSLDPGSFDLVSKEMLILYIKSMLKLTPRLSREAVVKRLSKKFQTEFNVETVTFIKTKVLEFKKLKTNAATAYECPTTEPIETEPVQVETEPIETEPVETVPVETERSPEQIRKKRRLKEKSVPTFFEKQEERLCAKHAVNNVLGYCLATKKEMNKIATDLAESKAKIIADNKLQQGKITKAQYNDASQTIFDRIKTNYLLEDGAYSSVTYRKLLSIHNIPFKPIPVTNISWPLFAKGGQFILDISKPYGHSVAFKDGYFIDSEAEGPILLDEKLYNKIHKKQIFSITQLYPPLEEVEATATSEPIVIDDD